MRGSLGIVIGLVIGAGGMYLALRPPWGGGATAPSIDAGVVSVAPSDGGVSTTKKKKRRPRPPGTVAAPGAPGDEEYYEETEPLPVLTDADRRLEWRGDDVTMGARKIDMGGGDARPLDDGEINNTINSQAGDVRTCIVQSATNSGLRATITVKLIVDGNGRVTKSKLQAPHYLFEKGLQACVQRAVKGMKFPATGAPTLVELPVTLG